MSTKSKPISDVAAKAAYMRAYVSGPNWEDIIGFCAKGIFSRQAHQLQTSLNCVMANVLCSISAVLGPATAVEVEEDYCIRTNLYVLLVAASGSGKSQGYERLFLRPIRALEKKEHINLLMEEFTPSGFLKFLVDNRGYGVFASDEFCQSIKAKMSSRHEENQGLRSQFCKFYNGQGISKSYASKDQLKVDDVYLTIFSLSQPQPYTAFHQELSLLKDGLISRFLIICCSPIPEDKAEQEDADQMPIAGAQNVDFGGYLYSEVVSQFLQILYFRHHSRRAVRYQFSLEAAEYLSGLKKLGLDAKKAAYLTAEAKIRDGTIDFIDIPEDADCEKDFDYVVKFSAVLHILNSTIADAVQKHFATIHIEPIIPKTVVERAHLLVTSMRSHQREFIKVFEDVVIPIQESVQISHVLQNDRFSIQKTILKFPGKVVSSQMIVRKHRRIHSRSMELPRIMMELDVPRGTPGYVGQYLVIDRNKHVFYKTAPENADKDFLESIHISEEEYGRAYHEDAAEPPCSGFRNGQNIINACWTRPLRIFDQLEDILDRLVTKFVITFYLCCNILQLFIFTPPIKIYTV